VTRINDVTYPCPHCSAAASPETGCPSCGRPADLDAVEVIRANAEIADLNLRLAAAWQRRNAAVARVQAKLGPRREASTKLVQNLLFLLGGLLLAVAAIVFAAVAWVQFGLGGRATLLATFTLVALAVPLLALRRRLRATAETFAAVGLLLLLLDGYAVWRLHPLGDAFRFAAVVCAVTAVVAVGYRGLTGPRYAALLVAQPVLPLLVAPSHPGAAGWAVAFAVVAALNMALFSGRRVSAGLRIAALVCAVLSGVVAGYEAVEAGRGAPVELGIGLALLVAMAVRRLHPTVFVAGLLIAAPGLAGLLDSRPATIAGLGAVLVAGVVAGAAGWLRGIRIAGWVVTGVAATGIALTAGDLLRFDPLGVALLVLGVGAAMAALAWVPLDGRPGERIAAEVAAHAAALVALVVAVESAGQAAVVCTVWGVVLAVRSLQPAGRRGYVLAAAGVELAAWLLLLASAEVTVLEAYTVPAAGVALLAGLLPRRTGRSSWTSFGPALAAGLLPSLASILVEDGQHLRRLLLGVAAIGVVLAGAKARLRAPVLLGGAVLTLEAVRELAGVWDLIPRWIPLAAGGLLLVVLASTLERRRRDLTRFRAAIHRMS
jgi:hypothetical protein